MEITIEQFEGVIADLEAGRLRVAEKVDGVWQVNAWVKEVILAGFRLGVVKDMSQGQFPFFDKDTFPVRKFSGKTACASCRAARASGAALTWHPAPS